MSYKDVLRVFKLERELTDDETATLNTLRKMSAADIEATVEAFGGSMGKSSKSTKPTTGRKIEYCAAEGCGFTKRAVVHKDSSAAGYHEFQQPSSSSKSRRAESLAGAIKKKAGDKEPRCVVCFEVRDHAEHDVANGGHEFEASVAARANAVLDKHNTCVALIDDNGGAMTCGRTMDDNIHHKPTDPDYHEFVASVGGETTVGVGGD